MALQNAFAGLATEPKQDTGNTSLASIDGKLPALSGGRVPVVLPAGGGGLTDTELRASPVATAVQAALRDWAPGYSAAPGGTASLTADPDGALITRGSVLTDEGSTRVNFANSSLAVSIGSCTFTNGSTAVTGSNFSSLVLDKGDYVKLAIDDEVDWAQVESIDSDSSITLTSAYTGGGGTGLSHRAMVKPTTGIGGTIAVSSGVCTLQSGTSISQTTSIERLIDYSPIGANIGVTVSQRIANNDTYIELRDPSATSSKYFCRIRLTGTTNTAAICETGYNPTTAPSGAETETTNVTLPNGANTAAARVFRIESMIAATRYYCDNVLIAEHRKVGPHPNDPMLLKVSTVNGGSAPATSTTVTVDHLFDSNFNVLNVDAASQNSKIVADNAPVETFTGSAAANNTDLVVIDCAKFRTLFVQLSGTFNATVSWQGSNDPLFGATISPVGILAAGGGSAISGTAAGHWYIPTTTRYIRFRTTAYTSGTPTVTVHGSQSPANIRSMAVDSITTVTANCVESTLVTPTALNINSAATTNATSVKASAGTVYQVTVSNSGASACAVKLTNKASAPTVGTDTPVIALLCPAGESRTYEFGRVGHRLTTGIALSITALMTDADTTAVAAGQVKVMISYI